MNLLERIEHIEEIGTASGLYRIYFKENDFCKDEKIVLNEKELYALDALYDGELAEKILN